MTHDHECGDKVAYLHILQETSVGLVKVPKVYWKVWKHVKQSILLYKQCWNWLWPEEDWANTAMTDNKRKKNSCCLDTQFVTTRVEQPVDLLTSFSNFMKQNELVQNSW